MKNTNVIRTVRKRLLVVTACAAMTFTTIAGPAFTVPAHAAVSTSSVLRPGSNSTSVKWLQRDLNVLGYKSGTADGRFGSNTAEAVKRFQRDYGLTADGVAGKDTISRLNDVSISLQKTLTAKGFGSLTADGLLGEESVNAINNAKRKMGLDPDGLADKYFRDVTLPNYSTGSSATSATSSSVSSSAVVSRNISRVSYIAQGSRTCKATSLAMSLNLITGSNSYTTGSLGNASCTNVNGKTYKGSDGAVYKASYKADSYVGSASEQKTAINNAMNAGVPIVVAVHKNGRGTQHHWIIIVRRNGSDYDIIDPASGTTGRNLEYNVKKFSSTGYAFGLADYSSYHYGYITFTKQ